jgi:predicted aminopeptidase
MRIRKRLWAAGALVIVAALILSPTGCYLSRGAWEEGKILARRQPIKELVASRHTDPLVRRKLAIVLEARQYAKDSIRLKTEESFTTYSKLDRDTLVMVLSAAYRDKLEPYTWWFPIVGRVPYKGFFDFDEAQKTAKKMYDEGYDVQVRPSPAFSTLGWFNDPLNSATLREDTLDLVNTVIHEVTHNTFYAPGKAVFNESFANFVGARGAAQFFRSRGQPEAAAHIDAEWADDKVLGDFWTSLARSLDSAYAEHPDSKAARIEARDTVYARARRTLVSDIGPQLNTVSPFYVQRVPLNNAALLARRVYAKDLDLFDQIYAREGKDLRRTIGRVIALAKSDKKDPYAALRRWLGLPPEKTPAKPD